MEQVVAGADDPGEAGLLEAEILQEFGAVGRSMVAISASIAAEMITAPAPSAAAFSNTRALWALPPAASPSSTLQT